jgi:hypothetical protein
MSGMGRTVGAGNGSLRSLLAAVLATGAAACSTLAPPVVDMEGVDQVKYNRDLAWCYNNLSGFEMGNAVTNCMERKGYKILVRQ